jgi:curli biogenesis system outer membrane secretion channel CsgG
LRRKHLFIFVLVLLSILVVASVASAQLKKRVAVFTFEDKSHHGWHWWDGKPPGEGMADMLTTELVKTGKYVVIERQEIAKVLEEQQLGQSGMVTEQSAAQLGKLLGVELAVMGAVTEFGYSKGKTGGRIKGIGIGIKKETATVAVDVRFVNTTTGEILAAESVRKENSASGLSLSTPKFGFDNRNDFDNSLVGKATREAIEDMMTLIDQQIEELPWSGKVIMVKGSTVYIKPGSDAGVNIGDSFVIYAEGEVLEDPDTGLVLGTIENKVGTIKVTAIVANGKAATASIQSGSGFKKGDLVKLK